MNNNEFFKKVASRCNYADPSFIKTLYLSMIRYILEELSINGIVTLPEFGIFRVIDHKERRIRDVNTGELKMVESQKSIKFNANKNLKYYIKNRL